jgi:hypothetical protein
MVDQPGVIEGEVLAHSAVGLPVFVWIIFPLADLRPILEPSRPIVRRPWQETSIRNFLRGFGNVCYRKNDKGEGNAAVWLRANEGWYISAYHFARVLPKDPPGARATLADGWQVRQAIAPRVFSDGVLSARLELVLEVTPPDGAVVTSGFLDKLAMLEVEIRRSQAGKRAPAREVVQLQDVGRHFRNAYITARLRSPDIAVMHGSPPKELTASIRPVDPLLLVLERPLTGNELPLANWLAPVQAKSTGFRALRIVASGDDTRDSATVSSMRRTFVRLYCLTEAMRQLRNRLTESDGGTTALAPAIAKQLGSLVQQVQDGTLALRNRPTGSLMALDMSMERFRIEAVELSEYLVGPSGKAIANGLAGFHQQWAQVSPRVKPETIEKVYNVGIKYELFKKRDVLLASSDFPPSFVASIQQSDRPNQQLYFDIQALSRTTSEGGELLLTIWLRAAVGWVGESEHAIEQLEALARESKEP